MKANRSTEQPNADPGSMPSEELVIRLTRQIYYQDADVFHAKVVASPFPIQGGDLRADVDAQLAAFQKLFHSQMQASRYYPYDTAPNVPVGFEEEGQRTLLLLGEAMMKLLPVSLSEELARTLQVVYVQGRGLRLIIEVEVGDKAERLLHLPWELLFFANTGIYPAQAPRFQLIRRLIGAPLQSPPVLQHPLRVIHVIASGSGPNEIEADLQQMERETLPQVTQPGDYKLVTDPGSVEALREAQTQLPATVLHFLGHGDTMSINNDGVGVRSYLRFTAENGQSQYVTGEQLRQIAGGTTSLQMIVLPACSTGSIAGKNIAYDLVLGGFPYVVAMQEEIAQPALKHFIQRFYTELSIGQTPEYAVAAGRHEIAVNLPGSMDWCLPVLYTSAGIAQRGFWRRVIEAVNRHLFTRFAEKVMWWSGAIGLGHLLIGLLLWISGVSLAAVDAQLLLWSMGWLPLISPLLAYLVYRFGELPSTGSQTKTIRFVLLLRMWAAVSVSIGFIVLYVGYFGIALLAGLGFWSLLTLPARWAILGIVQFIALFSGLAQAYSHGLGLITTNRIEDVKHTGSDWVMIFAGYLMMVAPPILISFIPGALHPPLLNMLLGVLNLSVLFLMWHERVETS